VKENVLGTGRDLEPKLVQQLKKGKNHPKKHKSDLRYWQKRRREGGRKLASQKEGGGWKKNTKKKKRKGYSVLTTLTGHSNLRGKIWREKKKIKVMWLKMDKNKRSTDQKRKGEGGTNPDSWVNTITQKNHLRTLARRLRTGIGAEGVLGGSSFKSGGTRNSTVPPRGIAKKNLHGPSGEPGTGGKKTKNLQCHQIDGDWVEKKKSHFQKKKNSPPTLVPFAQKGTRKGRN